MSTTPQGQSLFDAVQLEQVRAYLESDPASTTWKRIRGKPTIPTFPLQTADIADGAVTTPKLHDASVTTAKIVDAAVTAPKIADGNVTSAKIAASAGLVLRRNGGPFALTLNAWTTLWWDTLEHSEGLTFWNGSTSFDLLETGWHHITVTAVFDTIGAVGLRILDMTAGGTVVAICGPFGTAGFAGTLNLTYERYAGSTEYTVQALNTAGGSVVVYHQTPLVTARVER